MILAGVHGNEKCGEKVLKKISPLLKIESGRVLLGYGNPRALKANVRFTQANLNRMFKSDDLLLESDKMSYEYKRAQFLKKYLNQAEALLDIHASFTPNSKAFVICEKNANETIIYLPVDLVVSGFDNVEPGGTDYYMNNMGKIGICVECGYLEDPESARIAEESIYAFLKARGHLKNRMNPRKQSRIQVSSLYLTKTNNFILSKAFDDFEEIVKGQAIGTDGGEEIQAKSPGVILFARNRNKVGEEAFLLGEKKNSLV